MEKYFKPQEQMTKQFNDVERHALNDALKARVWLISDLQQSQPERARECLETALDDFKELGLKCDKIWYMGDSVQGSDIAHLKEMTQMQKKAFEELGIPVCYVMGNHDMDVMSVNERPPFYEAVMSHEGWKCAEKCDEAFYWDKIADFDVLFISDHFSEDLSWWTSHGMIRGDAERYPYYKIDKDIKNVMTKVKESGNKTITVSHYSFPGGNRASDFLKKLLPMPENVLMHIYGHSHIGDRVWGGVDAMRKVSWINDFDVPQIDVASLERGRGNAVRSAFLEIYEDSVKISFRNHDERKWTESFTKAIINC